MNVVGRRPCHYHHYRPELGPHRHRHTLLRHTTSDRAQKLTYANEGAEAAKKDAEVVAKKRKKEEEAAWEQNRDERVNNWRDFAKKGGEKGKKKKKLNVLGA
jgi:hypothetical protein